MRKRGGLTCHAAIVARELKIPTIVGTRIATKVLKDGDSAEVDAEKSKSFNPEIPHQFVEGEFIVWEFQHTS